MDGSRDSNSNDLHSSAEVVDDSGLELSLGLSYGGSRVKGKEVEGCKATAFPLDSSSERGGSGDGASGKAKHGRANGLDAALKRFLQGRLEEQEESARVLDGYLPDYWTDVNGSDQKNEVNSISNLTSGIFTPHPNSTHMKGLGVQGQGLRDKSAAAELQAAFEGKENPSVLNDLQIPVTVADAAAAAWGQLQQQGIPAHLIEALKYAATVGPGIDNNTTVVPSLVPHFEALSSALGQNSHSGTNVAHDAGQLDSEKSEQPRQILVHREILEHQRKFQEARKKRKHLIEEQKQQKKTRKEDDRTGPHGFRRPGSNTWVRGLEAPTPPSLEAGDDGEQFQEIRQFQCEIEGTINEKSLDTDQEESSETLGDCRESDVNMVQRLKASEYRGSSPPPTAGTVDLDKAQNDAWKQRLVEIQEIASYKVNMTENRQEKSWKNTHSQAQHRVADASYSSYQPLDSPPRRETGEASCQNSSTGSQSSEKKEDRSCGRSSPGDGEISSAPPTSAGSESGSAPANGFLPPMPITSALPYPLPSLSVVPMPYSLPVPLANTPVMPFPVGFSFPYLMQFVPPAGDSNSTCPLNVNSFQIPVAQGYMPYQIPSMETATSWMPVVRPPAVPTLCTPSSGVAITRMASGITEEDSKKVQGANIPENVRSQSPATATDTFMQGSHLLYRTASLSSTQDPIAALTQLRREADSQLLSSLPVTAAAGLFQTLPDPGKYIYKDQGGVGVFPGFAASLQTTESFPGHARHVPNNLDEGQKQDLAGQSGARTDDTGNKDVNLHGHEEVGRGLGSPFQNGTTENLPLLDGFSPELLNLRPGIAAGLKFGGTGSSPDLPWVSTTGSGPNGKTICGVLYRYDRSQVRIVCACHGRHMSPGEFIQHASGADGSNSEKSIIVNPVPVTSQPASALG